MKIAIIGASSRIGLETIDLALQETNYELHLFLRDAKKLSHLNLPTDRVKVFQGNALNAQELTQAIAGTDHVLVSLEGPMDAFTKATIEAMKETGVQKLTFIASLGVFNEVPGEFGRWIQANMMGYLTPYIKAIDLIEQSGLDFTIIRPGELTDDKTTDYVLTQRNETFKGRYCSRRSVARLALDTMENPKEFKGLNLGISDGKE